VLVEVQEPQSERAQEPELQSERAAAMPAPVQERVQQSVQAAGQPAAGQVRASQSVQAAVQVRRPEGAVLAQARAAGPRSAPVAATSA